MDIIRPQLDQVRIEKDGKLPFVLIDAIRKVYDYLSAVITVTSGDVEVIQGTHANRQILHPPGQIPIGSLYFETDRKVTYVNRSVLSAHAWVYFAGVMSGLVAARPTDLGTNDAGFLFTSTDSLDYRWSGTAWVALGTVKDGANLTTVGAIPIVSAAGTVTQSANLSFAGTTLSVTDHIASGYLLLDQAQANNAGQYLYSATVLKWFDGRLGGGVTWGVYDYVGGNVAFELATGNKMGFFGGAPIVKQTMAAYTSNNQGTAYTGIATGVAGTPYAQLTDLNTLRVAYENLRAAYDDLRTKLQTTTLMA